MKMRSTDFFVLLAILTAGIFCTAKMDHKYEPVMIAELWRHGVRTTRFNQFHQKYWDRWGSLSIVPNG